MRKFTDHFDIAKVVTPMANFTAVDPSTLKDAAGQYFELSKHATKRLADIHNMRSAQFSSTLYNTDADSWHFLHNRRLALDEVKDQIARNNAVVIDDFVVTIDEGDTHIEQVVEAINKFIDDESLTTIYRLHDKDQLIIISFNDKGYGVLIHYYMQGNWITTYDCWCNPDLRRLFVSPYKETDFKVDEDVLALLDKDQAILTSASTMSFQIESYLNRMGETFMSVDELCWYMKKLFKIKLGIDKFSVLDYAAEHEDLSGRAVAVMQDVIDKFYDNGMAYLVINSAYLKKATTMTKVTYQDFSNLLEILVLEDILGIDWLVGFQGKCINRDTHFHQLGLEEIH